MFDGFKNVKTEHASFFNFSICILASNDMCSLHCSDCLIKKTFNSFFIKEVLHILKMVIFHANLTHNVLAIMVLGNIVTYCICIL